MTVTFADFLGRLGEAELRAAMGEGRVLHFPAACDVPPSALFDFAALDQLMRRLPRPADHLRIITNGRDIDPQAARILDADQQLRPLILRNLLRQGAGVVVNKVHHHLPALWDLSLDAERRLGDRVSMAAVASYSAEAALPLHYDRSDVIALQLEGSKQWHFHGAPIAGCAGPMRPSSEAPAEVTATVTMQPGDLLFVPLGQHHVCTAQGRSLHLSLLVNHLNLADCLGDQVAAIAALNVPVRPFLGPEALAAQQSLLRSALADLTAGVDLPRWLAARNAEQARLGDDPGIASDPDARGARACFATTLAPALRHDGMIVAAGAAMPATPALLATIDALGMECRPVDAVIEQAGRMVGADEARAALHRLVKAGLVAIEP